MKNRGSKQSQTSEQIPLLATPDTNGLYFYSQLDPWQQDNHYIRSGYVKETNSYAGSIRSLLYLHNESVNIYTHLVPAFFAFIFFTIFIDNVVLQNEDHWWVRPTFMLFGVGLSVCLSLSALFHLFKSHSHLVCKFGNQCDYFGIVVMITCSLISVMSFIFYEEPKYKIGFIILFLILGSICTVVTFDSKFSTPHYRPFRSAMFILFGLSGILPVIGAVHLYGYQNAVQRSGAYWLIGEGFFYIFGACLYALRIPEKWVYEETDGDFKKGKFDIFGSLHQIFHVMVVIAAYCHWRGLYDSYIDWTVRTSVVY